MHVQHGRPYTEYEMYWFRDLSKWIFFCVLIKSTLILCLIKLYDIFCKSNERVVYRMYTTREIWPFEDIRLRCGIEITTKWPFTFFYLLGDSFALITHISHLVIVFNDLDIKKTVVERSRNAARCLKKVDIKVNSRTALWRPINMLIWQMTYENVYEHEVLTSSSLVSIVHFLCPTSLYSVDFSPDNKLWVEPTTFSSEGDG